MKTSLLTLVKTKKEAVMFASQLEETIQSLFTVKERPGVLIAKHFSFDKKEKLMEMMQQEGTTLANSESIQAFLKTLVDTLAQIPRVTVTLAIDPKEETIAHISQWITTNCKKDVLLDIVVDRNLIGGASFVYNGIFKDYSIKKTLTDYYSNKKSERTI